MTQLININSIISKTFIICLNNKINMDFRLVKMLNLLNTKK